MFIFEEEFFFFELNYFDIFLELWDFIGLSKKILLHFLSYNSENFKSYYK